MASRRGRKPRYFIVCQQIQVPLASVFDIVFNVIYGTKCSFAWSSRDILSDARRECLANRRSFDMDTNNDEILRICENPLHENFDVWKRRDKLGNSDRRSRQKFTGVDGKLKTYDGTAKKTDADNKNKDKPIDYAYIDEYCKVSAPKHSEDENCEPKQLKTNTTFGGSKIPFEKFSRIHIGGDTVDCTLTKTTVVQPVRCPQVDTRIMQVERSNETIHSRYYHETDDIPLRCCGHNVETAVDYCTCMFCVKGLFYHCTKDSCPETAVVDPCSCSPVNASCMKRWSILSVLAIFVPCLLCYPITRGCTEVCKCYRKQQESLKNLSNRTVQNRERERLT